MRTKLAQEWEARLRAEGMPAELPEVSPKPRLDRNWSSHFGGKSPHYNALIDACQRAQSDQRSTQELFAMLADIRWGRHDPTIPGLTDRERLVFDPYCDGQTEMAIAARLGIRQGTVSYRLRKIIARFTTVKPRLARGVRPKRRDR